MTRRNATAATKRRLRKEQGDRCAFRYADGSQCTMPIQIWEHGFHSGVPVGLCSDEEPDAGLCRGHAYLKTVNEDRPRIERAVRMGGGRGSQTFKRKTREAKGLPSPWKTRPFGPSRGFDKTKRKRMNGTVETRG